MLPERSFALAPWFGWTVNIVCHCLHSSNWEYCLPIMQISVAYIALTTILFLFPPSLPATGSSMSKLALSYILSEIIANLTTSDYCVAAFGIVFVISTIQWFVDGRKNFVGPRIEVEIFTGEAAPQAERPIPFVEQHKQ